MGKPVNVDVQSELESHWQRGDERGALATAWVAYGRELRRFAIRHGANESDSEDIVHAALLRVFQHHEAVLYHNVEAVLHTTVLRLLMNRRRDESRHRTVSIEEDVPYGAQDDEGKNPESNVASAEEIRRVQHAIERLPEEHRVIVRLRYLEDQVLEVEEIAARIGKSRRWVEKVITASRRELRELLMSCA